MTVHYPTLVEVRHGYPFLSDDAFDRRENGNFNVYLFRQLMGQYLERHIRWDIAKNKKGGDAVSAIAEAIERLIKAVRASCEGRDILGTNNSLVSFAGGLELGEHETLHLAFSGVALGLKRFGDCLGIQVLDNKGHVHRDATEIFEEWAESSCGLGAISPFVRAWHITMPRWKPYGNSKIDVLEELTSAARYVPDVNWHIAHADAVTDGLLAYYTGHDGCSSIDIGGTEVGHYHDIPVYAQVLFGDENRDRVWRKGSAARDGRTSLRFEANSSENPSLRYIISMAGKNNTFNKAEQGIDYAREQRYLRQLAEILLNAFAARDLAETIAYDPREVARKKAAG